MNDKLKEIINEAADKLYGIDNLIPPTPKSYKLSIDDISPLSGLPPGRITYVKNQPIIKLPFFNGTFIDCIAALCFVGGFISLGFAIGRMI